MISKNLFRRIAAFALIVMLLCAASSVALAGTEYSYKVNVLLPKLAAALSPEQLQACATIAQSVEDGATEIAVGISSVEQFMQAYSAYAASNPLSALINTANFDAGTMYVTYIYEQREHQEAIQRWHQLVDSLCAPCTGTEVDIARQLNIAVAKSIKYGVEYLEGTKDSSILTAYYALTQGEGLDPDFVKVYNYLLTQFGIECMEVHNTEHVWTVALLNGQYYHIDTACDSMDGLFGRQGDYSYSEYFGMGDVTRAISGPYETYTDAYNSTAEIVPACPADMQ